MSEPFLAEIKIIGENFAPRGWAFCDGTLLQIAQNTALFSLIGTTYGGDGRSTTALPNLKGRAPMHPGSGPGLTPRRLGAKGGESAVTLAESQIPQHNHAAMASTTAANSPDPTGNVMAKGPGRGSAFYVAAGAAAPMSAASLATAGLSQGHNNMQPYQVLNFVIALQGTYPSRS